MVIATVKSKQIRGLEYTRDYHPEIFETKEQYYSVRKSNQFYKATFKTGLPGARYLDIIITFRRMLKKYYSGTTK
jgi:hypothetical protein